MALIEMTAAAQHGWRRSYLQIAPIRADGMSQSTFPRQCRHPEQRKLNAFFETKHVPDKVGA